MTTGPNHPLRREADRASWFARSRAWWRLSGPLILGPLYILLAAWLFFVSVKVYAQDSATDTAARVNCERAREFGPYIANDFEARSVFPTKTIMGRYRLLIPRECPK